MANRRTRPLESRLPSHRLDGLQFGKVKQIIQLQMWKKVQGNPARSCIWTKGAFKDGSAEMPVCSLCKLAAQLVILCEVESQHAPACFLWVADL